jgi:hypothetical protein
MRQQQDNSSSCIVQHSKHNLHHCKDRKYRPNHMYYQKPWTRDSQSSMLKDNMNFVTKEPIEVTHGDRRFDEQRERQMLR